MNPNQRQLYQPSGPAQSSQSTPLATTTGHPDHTHAQAHQIHSVNPLHTLKNPTVAHTLPYLYTSGRYHNQIHSYSPNPPSCASTPSHTTATPSPILSVRTQSTRHSSLQPPSTRIPSTQSSSNQIPRNDTRSIPRKRARNHTPNPPTLYPTSPVPPPPSPLLGHPPHLQLPSHQLLPTEPSSERLTKRPRLDMGHPSTAANRNGLDQRVFSHPDPPSKPKPKPKKTPPHPLAVDYGRPINWVVPRPPPRLLGLQKKNIPLPPFPEIPDPKRSLDDELKGPIDPVIAKELGDLMWVQQNRVWKARRGSTNPPPSPTPFSPPDIRSSSSRMRVTPVQPRPEVIALYGPPPRNNESVRLGEGLTDPNVIVLDDDEDDGFEEVLDFYRGAVQGSSLSMELELVVGGPEVGLIGVGWEGVSSLEVSIERGSSAPSSSGEPQESRIRTLAEYERVVEAEKKLLPLGQATTKGEPPLGIMWSYSCCGYATGKVVNVRNASVTSTETHTNCRKRRR